MSKKKQQQSGLESYLSQMEVKGFVVKEWTIGQLAQLSPMLSEMAKKAIALGVTFDNLESFIADNWAEMLGVVGPYAPHILCISFKKPMEQIEDLPAVDGSYYLALVMQKNVTHITDFFGQLGASPSEVPAPTMN